MSTTPADTIARAAKLMRSRAEEATEGSWYAYAGGVYIGSDGTIAPCLTRYEDAEHIAGLDPTFAITMADWLAKSIAVHEACLVAHPELTAEFETRLATSPEHTLARAYLRENQ